MELHTIGVAAEVAQITHLLEAMEVPEEVVEAQQPSVAPAQAVQV
jgi:hypothetical protein